MQYEKPDFVADSVGECEGCYEPDVALCTVPGYLRLCQRCYDDELTVCQHCGDSYLYDAIAWQVDGEDNYICEYCAEELEAEEEQ